MFLFDFVFHMFRVLFQMFAELNTKLEPLYSGVNNNRNNWQALADEHERKMNGDAPGENQIFLDRIRR